jgi:collagen type II alpha
MLWTMQRYSNMTGRSVIAEPLAATAMLMNFIWIVLVFKITDKLQIIFLLLELQLTYKADSNQVGFLQLLSKGASQNLTYHCRNSVAYFDTVKRTYRKGIKLLTWNDAEITPRGSSRFRYDVGEDECRVSATLIHLCQVYPHSGI